MALNIKFTSSKDESIYMKRMSDNSYRHNRHSSKLFRVRNRLGDCLDYIRKEKPNSSDYRRIACLVILEEDLLALIEEYGLYAQGFCVNSNLISAFLERCATVIEEVVSMQPPSDQLMVIKPFAFKLKNYYHHSSRH